MNDARSNTTGESTETLSNLQTWFGYIPRLFRRDTLGNYTIPGLDLTPSLNECQTVTIASKDFVAAGRLTLCTLTASSYVHLEPASLQLWTKILLQKTPKHLLPLISLPQMCLAKTCSLSLPRLNSHSRPPHAATPNGIADHRSDLTLPFPIDPEFGANSMRRGTM